MPFIARTKYLKQKRLFDFFSFKCGRAKAVEKEQMGHVSRETGTEEESKGNARN